MDLRWESSWPPDEPDLDGWCGGWLVAQVVRHGDRWGVYVDGDQVAVVATREEAQRAAEEAVAERPAPAAKDPPERCRWVRNVPVSVPHPGRYRKPPR